MPGLTGRGGRGGAGLPGITTGRPGMTFGPLAGLGGATTGGRGGAGGATAGTAWAGPGSAGAVGGGAAGGGLIGCVDPPDGCGEDFGKPGGRGATGRGSCGGAGSFTGASISTGACVATAGALWAGGVTGLGSGTGTAIGGAGGGAGGGATGAVATPAVPADAAGGAVGPDRVGGRKLPSGGRTGPPPWTPVRIEGVACAASGRAGRLAAGVGRGRLRTGSSNSCGFGTGCSFRCPLNLSRTLPAVASSSALECDFDSWTPNSGSAAMISPEGTPISRASSLMRIVLLLLARLASSH